MDRKPHGYVGTNHETLGSDILSILGAVAFPERVLGAEVVAKLQAIEPKGWYPIADFLDPLAVIEAQVGPFGLVSMGRELFRLSHEAALKAHGRTAADVIYGIDGMYHHANRGQEIGGWRVLSFEPGTARLEKTTPHPCKLEEGILAQALMTLGVPSIVEQRTCFKQGADVCVFSVISSVTAERWGTARTPASS